MFKISENNLILFPSFCLFGNRLRRLRRTRDNLPLPQWTCTFVGMLGMFTQRWMQAHVLWLTVTERNLTNVTWSLSTFEADPTCQSALGVECFWDACFHPQGVCVNVCVWVPPPCFLPGKTLLSLLALAVMSPLPGAQLSCQRQSETVSWTTRWRATEI